MPLPMIGVPYGISAPRTAVTRPTPARPQTLGQRVNRPASGVQGLYVGAGSRPAGTTGGIGSMLGGPYARPAPAAAPRGPGRPSRMTVGGGVPNPNGVVLATDANGNPTRMGRPGTLHAGVGSSIAPQALAAGTPFGTFSVTGPGGREYGSDIALRTATGSGSRYDPRTGQWEGGYLANPGAGPTAAQRAQAGQLGYQERAGLGLPQTEDDRRSALIDRVFGGGMAGNGTGGGAAGPNITGASGGLGGAVEQGILGQINNPDTISPQDQALIEGRIGDDVAGARVAREREIREDYGRRGLGGSDLEAAALRDAAEGADRTRSNALRDIGIARATGRSDARSRALGMGLDYLGQSNSNRRSDLALLLQLLGG